MLQIKSVKKGSDSGLEIKYVESIEQDGQVKYYEIDKTFPDIPHRDLTELFDKLKEPVLKTWGFKDLFVIMEKGNISREEKEAFQRVEKYINGLHKKNLEKLEITGVTIAGDNGDKVKISGKFEDIAGVNMAINAHLIHCDRETYGVESLVGEVIYDLKKEVEYYIGGKHSKPTQMEIE